MYAWIVLVILSVVVVVILIWYNNDMREKLIEWSKILYQQQSLRHTSSTLIHTMTTVDSLGRVCSMMIVSTVMFIVVVLTSYLAMKLGGTVHVNNYYQQQYLYSATSAYFIGVTPAVLIWLYVTLSGLTVITLSTSHKMPVVGDADMKLSIYRRDARKKITASIYETLLQITVSILIIAASGAINFLYVYIVYFLNPSSITAVQFAFAIAKSLFSNVVVPYSTKLISKPWRQRYSVVMIVIVNIVAPAVAVLLTSPLCLLYKIKPASVLVTYSIIQYSCSIECINRPTPVTTTFIPPWFYSYQCSSSFLVSYLPNFIFFYIISGIAVPLISLIQLPNKFKTNLNAVVEKVSKLFDVQVPSVFLIEEEKAKEDKAQLEMKCSPHPKEESAECVRISEASDKRYQSTNPNSDSSSEIRISDSTPQLDKRYEMDLKDLMPSICYDITVFLTFGLASPLLAVIITCSTISKVFVWRLAIGRYISVVSKAIGEAGCYEQLEAAFECSWECLPMSWRIISVYVGIFWSLFMNDMIGDSHPTGGIVAAILMMIWCPLVFISAQRLLTIHRNSSGNSSTSSNSSGNSIEKMVMAIDRISLSIHNSIWSKLTSISIIGMSDDSRNRDNDSSSDGNDSNISSGSSISANRISTPSECTNPMVTTINH